MNVPLADRESIHHRCNTPDIVPRFGHRRADICKDNRRPIAVNFQRFQQIIVIDLAVALRTDRNMPHPQEVQILRYAIVGRLGIIDHPTGMQFAR